MRDEMGQRVYPFFIEEFGPEYMSPEQVAGDQPGPASDEYSLATVVHEMLTGQTPFSGPTAQAILYRRLTSPPPSVRDCRPGVLSQPASHLLQSVFIGVG